MPRVKRGVGHLKRRKRLLKKASGFKWGRNSNIKQARTAVLKAGVNAYRGRKTKKRDNRALWNTKLNAAVREHGISYSVFIGNLKKAKIELDRKVLSQLAEFYPDIFAAIVKKVK